MSPAVRSAQYAVRSAHDDHWANGVGQGRYTFALGARFWGSRTLNMACQSPTEALPCCRRLTMACNPRPSRHGSSTARVEFRDGFNCYLVARTGMKRMWRTAALRLSTNATESGAKKASTVS